MNIINQEMPCLHQYRIFLQSAKASFHIGFIHARWFESIPSENIVILKGVKDYTSIPLYYINQIRTTNVNIPAIRENVNKKVQFGTTMSIAKTSVQIAVAESVTAELTGILMQFIMKYRHNTGLGVEEVHNEISLTNRQPLASLDNISEISNPEYHRPKGRPPK